jgi:hypothetical protein
MAWHRYCIPAFVYVAAKAKEGVTLGALASAAGAATDNYTCPLVLWTFLVSGALWVVAGVLLAVALWLFGPQVQTLCLVRGMGRVAPVLRTSIAHGVPLPLVAPACCCSPRPDCAPGICMFAAFRGMYDTWISGSDVYSFCWNG